ncbi:MAG: hypothetical protein GX842_04850, partial [Spirochaetales bacterium]|nr:hypothetical protein [Spirochaetales bacterium]
MVKNRIVLFILFITLFSLSAAPTEGVNLLLLSSEIATAHHSELVSRLNFLSLSTEGESEELRQRLYDYYQLTPLVEEEVVSGEYSVEIINGQRLQVGGKDNQFILLEGNVQITLTKIGEEESTEIGAKAIVVDLDEEYLVALNDVGYTKGGDALEDNLFSQILTVRWKEGSLRLSRGSLEMVRDSKDGDEIKFYTTGEEI